MALCRRLFQNYRYHLIGVFAVVLTGCLYANPIGGQTMLSPDTSPKAQFVTQRLNLETLQPTETPLVPLAISDDQLAAALPNLTVTQNRVAVVGGWETLDLRFDQDGDPVAAATIVRVTPIDALKRTISSDFALFSGPIDDLTLQSDASLDLFATFANTDAYAWAVRGSFYTKVNGTQAPQIAQTVTNLLFQDQ